MKILQEVNISKDKKILLYINVLAVVLLFFFGFLFTLLAIWLKAPGELVGTFGFWDFAYLLLAFIVILIIHELVHGLFFKLFNPKNKVKFGILWKSGMLYATSPGSRYSRSQFLIIVLAPFVFWTLTLTLAYAWGLLPMPAYILLASMHASGCAGDFYFAYLLALKHSKDSILVEDTDTGLIIYQAD